MCCLSVLPAVQRVAGLSAETCADSRPSCVANCRVGAPQDVSTIQAALKEGRDALQLVQRQARAAEVACVLWLWRQYVCCDCAPGC